MPAQSKLKKNSPRRVRKWSKGVKTESTFPPKGTFTKPAEEVAHIMARKEVSPGGIGSANKMFQLFINRAGRNMSPGRKRQLERAKRILQEKKR
jgi:uncharacterized protein DUF3175